MDQAKKFFSPPLSNPIQARRLRFDPRQRHHHPSRGPIEKAARRFFAPAALSKSDIGLPADDWS
jgi:hypothetical protein